MDFLRRLNIFLGEDSPASAAFKEAVDSAEIILRPGINGVSSPIALPGSVLDLFLKDGIGVS